MGNNRRGTLGWRYCISLLIAYGALCACKSDKPKPPEVDPKCVENGRARKSILEREDAQTCTTDEDCAYTERGGCCGCFDWPVNKRIKLELDKLLDTKRECESAHCQGIVCESCLTPHPPPACNDGMCSWSMCNPNEEYSHGDCFCPNGTKITPAPDAGIGGFYCRIKKLCKPKQRYQDLGACYCPDGTTRDEDGNGFVCRADSGQAE
jgi:hypothetical protein